MYPWTSTLQMTPVCVPLLVWRVLAAWDVIIGSHLGRPKGVANKFSWNIFIKHLSELLGVEVQFANDCMGEEGAVKAAAATGEVLLLENLRFYAEEEGKPRGLAEDATDEGRRSCCLRRLSKKRESQRIHQEIRFLRWLLRKRRVQVQLTVLTLLFHWYAKYFDINNKMFGYLMEKESKGCW